MGTDQKRIGPGSKLPSPRLSQSFGISGSISTAARTPVLTRPATVGTRMRVSARAITFDKIRFNTTRSSIIF